MIYRVLMVVVLVSGLSVSSNVLAQDHSGCAGVGSFVFGYIGAVSSNIPGVSNRIQFAFSWATAEVGADIGDLTCDSIEDLADWYLDAADDWTLDYDEFVDVWCDGNPMNCPGNLTTGNPLDCHLIIDCWQDPMQGPYGHPFDFTVHDVINSLYFVDASQSFGYWAWDEMGHLVNYQPTFPTDPY